MKYLLCILFLLVAFASIVVLIEKSGKPEFLAAQVIPSANEAVLSLLPKSGAYSQGSAISVSLKISASSSITSLRAYLTYDPSLVSVSSIQKTGSVFLTWWEEAVDSQNGKIQLQASLPSPGFSGNNGSVATLNFKVLKPGTLLVKYDASSLALKSDDTNILNIAKSEAGSFTLSASQAPVPPPSPLPPAVLKNDCNNDSKFNILDFAIMQSNWKKKTSSCELTKDGVIDIFDLSVLMSNWTG